TLSDAGYQKFISWLNAGNFNYKTKSETDLEKFEIAAKSENLTESIKSNLVSIREAVEKSKQADLITFKNQIIRQLEDEIVIRYHYTNAAKFMSFESDVEVQQAISVFQDKLRYNKLLSGVK
ncbi:MAG: peptidase S41, partial [Spirosomataceae bacterium]